jgi:hypothetical protein
LLNPRLDPDEIGAKRGTVESREARAEGLDPYRTVRRLMNGQNVVLVQPVARRITTSFGRQVLRGAGSSVARGVRRHERDQARAVTDPEPSFGRRTEATTRYRRRRSGEGRLRANRGQRGDSSGNRQRDLQLRLRPAAFVSVEPGLHDLDGLDRRRATAVESFFRTAKSAHLPGSILLHRRSNATIEAGSEPRAEWATCAKTLLDRQAAAER